MTDTQGRDNVTPAPTGVDDVPSLSVLPVTNIANTGAYLSNFAPGDPDRSAGSCSAAST